MNSLAVSAPAATKPQPQGRRPLMLSRVLLLVGIVSSVQVLQFGSIREAASCYFSDDSANKSTAQGSYQTGEHEPEQFQLYEKNLTTSLRQTSSRPTDSSKSEAQKPRVAPFTYVGDKDIVVRRTTLNISHLETNGNILATKTALNSTTSVFVAESNATPKEVKNATKCVANAEWQTHYHPTCNNMHELPWNDLLSVEPDDAHSSIQLLGNGATSDAWRIGGNADPVVLRTMRYHRDVDEINFQKNRAEASIMDRLTSSPYIIDIYTYCANSGLFEFADGGNMLQEIEQTEHTSLQKLEIAVQAASAIRDVHSIDFANRSTIAHRDIKVDQFMLVQGRYKLNDFNIASMIERNVTNPSRNCPSYRSSGGKNGRNRAPEELKDRSPLTEKIDVYAFGNVLYTLLNRHMPFHSIDYEEAGQLLKKGNLPAMNQTLLESSDPIIAVLINATIWCQTFIPEQRPTMQSVSSFLHSALLQHSP